MIAPAGTRLAILDGFALVHRAYFAQQNVGLSVQRTGEPTGAVYGFASTLLNLLKDVAPTHLAVAMDAPGPTFRHDRDANYKAHRPPMPDDLRAQFDRVRELIAAFNIPIYEVPGFEADDVLGTLARQALSIPLPCHLVTLDSDIVQLVEPGVCVYMYLIGRGGTKTYTSVEDVIERYGVTPAQIPDLKGLKGDTSDNIPGVPGIGEKTAVKLISQFGSVENILAHLDEVAPARIQAILRANAQLAIDSREMARIVTNAPVELNVAACEMHDFDRNRVIELFEKLEFRSLIGRVPQGRLGPARLAVDAAAQPDGHSYTTVTSFEELDRAVAAIRAAGVLAFDTETTSTRPSEASLVGISLAAKPGEAWYIPVGHLPELEAPEQLPVAGVLDRLRPLFDDPSIEKVAHNAKYDMIVLSNAGLACDSVAADTMIAAYLLGDRDIGLKPLAREVLGVSMTPISDLIGTGAKQISMAQTQIAVATEYAAADADMTLRLRAPVESEVAARGLDSLYRTIELPLIPALMRMERRGVWLDVEVLREMGRIFATDLQRIEESIHSAIGHSFNLSSPKQLSAVLFEELQLPKTRRTTQGYSTDAQALEGLRGVHPAVDQLLEYRQISKLKSTYIDALPGLISPSDGRVHTSYSQTTAATGRLSSQDPNLQNIPVRTEMGRRIRSAFVARDPLDAQRPMMYLACDYSQVELRILAHVTQEPRLVSAFQNDLDIHKATAADIFGVPLDEVTSDQRRLAKTVNFAVIYGLSDFGLAQRTELSRSEATEFIKQYFERYPGIKQYLDDTVAKTRQLGYAETLLGRRRYLPEITATSYTHRQAAERMATNHPIQGTNADIIKIAMIRIDEALRASGLESAMILQIHDELIWECPVAELSAVTDLVVPLMNGAAELSVPLKVEVKTGRNWGEME
jgi:DNA polymerase I